MTDILSFDGAALLAAYRNRTLSPREVVDAALAAIQRHNGTINAFCIVDAEAARTAAGESEARWAKGAPKGIADGLPFTVKDNLYWAGHPMRRGSKTSPEAPVPENAPAVDRLLEAGAIPLGKTVMPEYGWKGLGESPLHGPARNPWDTSRTPGGSSAGAAAAAALNLGVLHLGTDGAGSIRIPASFTGVYGIKPSWGRVPASPPSPFGVVAHVGPITRSVRDSALMLSLIGAPDVRDMTAMTTSAPDYRVGLEDGVRGLRIAWSPRLGYVERLDPEVEALTAKAARAFEELGATVEEADPGFSDPLETLNSLWHVGAWSVLRGIPEARWSEMDPGLVAAGLKGRGISGSDFVAASTARGAVFAAMARLHERYDLMLTPTLATTAIEAGRNTPADGRFGDDWLAWTPYSYPFNLTLQPAASVPCGLTQRGLPVGLQIVGPMGRDDLVLKASRAFESARPWQTISEPRVRH
ncbi:MAG TPA: amidase [Beijerinckiaceae bacterium]|nr:amidase [Beijerinckiaceae bacterium]